MEPFSLNWRLVIKMLLSYSSSLTRLWGPVDLWDGHHSFLDEAMVKHIPLFFSQTYLHWQLLQEWQPVSRGKLSTSLVMPLGSLEIPCLHQHMAKCAPTTGDPRVTASPWSSQLCTTRAKTAPQTSSVS